MTCNVCHDRDCRHEWADKWSNYYGPAYYQPSRPDEDRIYGVITTIYHATFDDPAMELTSPDGSVLWVHPRDVYIDWNPDPDGCDETAHYR